MFTSAVYNPHQWIALLLLTIVIFGNSLSWLLASFRRPRQPRIIQNPLNIDEIRRNVLQHLPRSDLINISTVSNVFYSSARELLEMRLHLLRSERRTIWERISTGTAPAFRPRYSSATIDLALNPGEILSALLLTTGSDIKVIEFTSSTESRAEWALTLTSYMLSAIVAHLPHAHHLILYRMSLRFQFTLLHAAHRQITTLELHNATSNFSHGYSMRRVSLETLTTLHLFNDSSLILDFLSRVVMFIDAPYVTTLTLGNCLSRNSIAVRDVVRAFGRSLTRLHLLSQTEPNEDEYATGTVLPPLPLLQHLELETSWAGLYLTAHGAGFPSIHTVALHSSPEQIMAGLPGFDWATLRDGLVPLEGRLKQLTCCYRAQHLSLRDSFRNLVAEQLREVGPPLPDNVEIVEGLRDPLPVSPLSAESAALTTTWDL
ncbi:hypothetical protein AAF712_015680 [Marasmius tenuissimus]|uniref:F-box domain-containing protein n=1 Tax=Marasmius tenuissimus TaxID=585030 RepID=A0ABR2Z8U3_9AGAR